MRLQLVSGGQTGADRATLDLALERGIRYGGWCPRGGWAEDRLRPPGLLTDYPALRETPSTDPAERTRWNVRDSDATLVVLPDGAASAGTTLTVQTAAALGRPVLVVADASDESVERVVGWLATTGSRVLNVAGPRASESLTAYDVCRRLLGAVLEDLDDAESGPTG